MRAARRPEVRHRIRTQSYNSSYVYQSAGRSKGEGQKGRSKGIFEAPKEALTARNIVDTWRPLVDAQLVEFGFSGAELF